MQPWVPTFAFDLQTDDGSTTTPLSAADSPCLKGGRESDPHVSCCHASTSLGGGGGADGEGGQLGAAQALLLDHPELGVSGVRVDHHHRRVEVLAASETQVMFALWPLSCHRALSTTCCHKR
jgi:hypothetical protein